MSGGFGCQGGMFRVDGDTGIGDMDRIRARICRIFEISVIKLVLGLRHLGVVLRNIEGLGHRCSVDT